MDKGDPKFRRFANLQGHLQKLSSNFFLGYQSKFWKVIENGTKVGYSNEPGQPIKAQNIFSIKDCFASEASGNTIFELKTRDKVFTLKAPNEEERTDWIKGLTFLKKVLNNQIKLKNQVSPTETTIASQTDKLKTKIPKIQPSTAVSTARPRAYQPDILMPDVNLESELIEELIKFLPQKCLKYYTLLTNLKVKSQGLFMDSMTSSTYLLISPKSLYPEIYIGEDNLTNVSLPPWLQLNYFYKILNSQSKEKKKQIFHTSKIIDIQEGSQQLSIKINTGEVIYEFFTDNLQQRQCLKNCLELAVDNAEEVVINGKTSKKNFDKLIDLHETKLPEFEKEVKEIIQSFMKNDNDRKFQPAQLFQFMDSSMKFLQEFITILEHKKKNKDHVILDMLKFFHEEVKTQSKLTWDSSFFGIKGVEILNMLKKLSEYYQMMKSFIKSAQFLEGMKQLSKIYVRESWKNFQSIIMSIVEQQKNKNIFADEQCEFIQTYGVTDLFKFIYNVFDLAYPHWKNKIHLHNVNRLTQRALQVFVNELRSMIDQEVIEEQQMIGLANNYFSFNDYVKEFYTEKFQELVDKTNQPYDKVVASYREISMIILQKIAHTIGIEVENYCQKCTIQTIKVESLQQILAKSLYPVEKVLHMAFQSKLNQKLANQVQIKICQVVMEQTKLKKRLKLTEIIRCVRQLRTNLNKAFNNVCKNFKHIDKKMKQLEVILSYDLISQIQEVIISSSDPLKRIYLKVLQLREDYSEGSLLYKIVREHSMNEENPETKTYKRRGSIDLVNRQKHATISKQYFLEEIMDSDDNQQEKSVAHTKKGTEGNKLISEGELSKGKRNKKVWEKSYFRLKNGFLYIFPSADSDRCHNAIEIKNIIKIDVVNKQKPSFLLTYKTLNKQKQIKLKAETVELRERWVNSLQLEKKRMLNEEQVKKKSIKYKETQNNGRKKYQMIIDYEELEKGKDYFSYSV